MKFIVSIKQSTNGTLIIITDNDLLGKKFEQGKLQLDLTKKFYQGEEKNENEVKEILKKADHLHLTGEVSVAIGIELNLIESRKIVWIAGIPHAEMVLG